MTMMTSRLSVIAVSTPTFLKFTRLLHLFHILHVTKNFLLHCAILWATLSNWRMALVGQRMSWHHKIRKATANLTELGISLLHFWIAVGFTAISLKTLKDIIATDGGQWQSFCQFMCNQVGWKNSLYTFFSFYRLFYRSYWSTFNIAYSFFPSEHVKRNLVTVACRAV